MNLYLLSLVPFLVGPLLVGVLQRRQTTLRLLDLGVVIGVGAVVLLGVLPQTIAEAGMLAVVGALVGLGLPLLTRGLLHESGGLGSRLALAAGIVGLALHEVADGMALTEEARHLEHGSMLAAAVLLHRLPVAMAIWWVVRPRHGRLMAAAVLAVILTATSVGFFGMRLVEGILSGHRAWPAFQALVAGAMLHVVFDHGFRTRKGRRQQGAS